MKKYKDFEVNNDMGEVFKAFNLACPKCGKITVYKIWRTTDDKVFYECTVCGNVVVISKGTAESEEKLKVWSALMEMYKLLSEGGGKIGFAYDIAKLRLRDEKLERKIDMILRDIERLREEIWERLRA
jgi:predicted RNA-binding Zn-ribbon protein involved in translation (DUF1610 family)